MRIRRAIFSAFSIVPGCVDPAPGLDGFVAGPSAPVTEHEGPPVSTSSSSGPTSSSTGGDLSTGTEGSSSGSAEPKLDMPMPDLGPAGPVGCGGKIDFLFVISSQWTMWPQQQKLLEAYPEFMKAIEKEFPAFDRHILVTDGGNDDQMDDCTLCADPQDCDPYSEEKSCGIPYDPCDKKLGAGIIFPKGKNATNHRCDLFGGRRYIIEGEPDPLAAFECIAQVGTGGDGEQVAEAMMLTFGDDLNGYKRCNDGFLRDDALLVATLIKDNADVDSKLEPIWWLEALYAAKGGDEDAVLLLVITSDYDLNPSLCFPGETWDGEPSRLRQFADMTKHGHIESICAPSFGPFFTEAVAEIRPLCDSLIPQ